jgi:D-3-phosphoglycerate dehydrogenase
MQPVIDRFREVFRENDIELVVPPVAERLDEEELLRYVEDIDGAIAGDDRWTERVLRAAPKLKVISKWGTGIDSIDQDACRELGISVRNTPNAFSEPVADTVMAYVLAFARRLLPINHEMHEGKWEKLPGVALAECALGVIGVGNVGKAVVRRAIAFGADIVGNDIAEMPPDFLAETGIHMASKEELLRRADFVSLNCDLNPTSFHLIGERELALMKPTAYLINTSRGPVIDEPALIEALRAGKIAGAGLDVFEAEPLPQDSPLRSMPNVLLSPHNANSSPVAWERVHHSTISNLLEALNEDAS